MVPHIGESGPRSRTLAWLLEASNPSARYLTLTRILGQSEDTPEVRASRAAIRKAAPARDILGAQYPQGYWMHPGIGYSPRYRATVWQILVLAQLGIARCEALNRAVEYLFEANQRPDGAFRASKEPEDTPIGLNGSLLWALETLGYGQTAPVRCAWAWLAREVEAGGLGSEGCDRPMALRGTVKVVWAANRASRGRYDDEVEFVRRAAAASLLDAPLDRAESDRRWSLLTFPLTETADLLQWTAVLVEAGYGDDPRLTAARSWIAGKRRRDGRWPLERVPAKLWASFGELHQPNKWITIRALAVDL